MNLQVAHIKNNKLILHVDDKILFKRKIIQPDLRKNKFGTGRELFVQLKNNLSGANEGATIFKLAGEE